METSRIDRYAPLAGVAAAVLWVVGVIVLEAGGNPGAPESAEVLAEHFRDNRTAILAAGTLHALGGVLFLLFVAWLYAAVRGRGGSDVLPLALLAGGIAGGALMLALMGPQTTGATTDVELLSPEASLVYWRLAHAFFVAAELALALFTAAAALLVLAGRLPLPRWLGWAGLVLALILLITPIGWIALLFLLPLWLGAASVMLFVRGRRDPARA
jgi:hypothetical protein